jgi:diacylglycerol kinase (ATP)
MMIAPEARLDDGLFDVCVLGPLGRLEFLQAFPRVFRGTHATHPKITFYRARTVRLRPAGPAAFLAQADGELIGRLPQEFVLEPAALTLLGPGEMA